MSLLRAASLIALLSLASKFVGLFRDQVIAYYCGLNAITDAYQVASLIPVQFALIMLGGLNGPFHSAVVSTLMQSYEKNDRHHYGRVLTTALVLSTLFMGSLSALLYFFAPQIVVLWQTMPPETTALAVLQLRIMAPVFVISGWIGILYGILSLRHSFLTPSLSPIMASLAVIVALVLANSTDASVLAQALAWGTLVGAVLQLLLQVLPLLGFLRGLHLEFNWQDPDFQGFLHLLLPAMLSSTIGQVNIFVIQFFAGGLREGSIAAFRYGNLIIQLPLGILLTALLVPLLPLLSSAAREDSSQADTRHSALKMRLNQGLRPVLLITVPITLLLCLLGYFAIVLLFERGQFDAADSWLTFQVLVYLSLSITVYAIRDLLIRAFYALGDSRVPFLSSFVTIAAMMGFSALLAPRMGVSGVALASSIAAALNFMVLAMWLRRRIGPWMQPETWTHCGKVLLAAIPLAGLGFWSYLRLLAETDYLTMIGLAIVDGALLSGLYLFLLIALRDREVLALLARPLRRLGLSLPGGTSP
ncbi:MAG: murein biosynthesis integral membrane protein MurJ [Candidatus Sericytochromatia bacterium]